MTRCDAENSFLQTLSKIIALFHQKLLIARLKLVPFGAWRCRRIQTIDGGISGTGSNLRTPVSAA
jgi:hypothetical protein